MSNLKHGMAETPTWRSWSMMRRRCNGYTPLHKRVYVDRGIKVCERWKVFENFLADMGIRPEGKTLDRIDNNKGYSPDNCRWATSYEQMANRRFSKIIEYNGKRQTIAAWSRELGIDRNTIPKRIKKGWPIEKVLKTVNRRNHGI